VTAGEQTRAGRVQVVCTGNVCRSPYVERRLAQLLSDTGIEIESAGTGALVGSPMEPGSLDALASVGAAHDNFVARQLTPAILDRADLVITATQRHRVQAVTLHPTVLRRTFSLGELADLLRDVDLRATAGEDAQASWAAHVAHVARERRGLVSTRPAADTDVPDPYRRGPEAYAQMTHAVESLLLVVAPALRPPWR
jgi:protein-tyrosine phosphatase